MTFCDMGDEQPLSTGVSSYRLLLVDDDLRLLEMLGQRLKLEGHVVFTADSVAQGMAVMAEERPDAVVIDYRLPDGSAVDFIKAARGVDDGCPIIVFTGGGTFETAVDCIKAGADNFVAKPVELPALLLAVERALGARREERRAVAKRRTRAGKLDPFVGTSPHIRGLAQLAEAVLQSEAPILILGETGTGKGVLSRWFHERGPRQREPYVDLNCAGLSRELAESELFGHRRGSFTGAAADKLGLVELAHKGTLFLDEIGDLDISVQPKLLKVLEDKTFRRIGDTRARSSDVRLITATHRDLMGMTREGSFRNDLLFRINTVTIELPPLRTRPEDIIPLAEQILSRMLEEQGRSGCALSSSSKRLLSDYEWPGNVRELRNVLERALIFCRGDELDVSSVLSPARPSARTSQETVVSPLSLDALERQHILQTLEECGGRVEVAAERLGISRSSLYAKLKRYGAAKTSD
jgi:DNA-binding NtrC family response regulator